MPTCLAYTEGPGKDIVYTGYFKLLTSTTLKYSCQVVGPGNASLDSRQLPDSHTAVNTLQMVPTTRNAVQVCAALKVTLTNSAQNLPLVAQSLHWTRITLHSSCTVSATNKHTCEATFTINASSPAAACASSCSFKTTVTFCDQKAYRSLNSSHDTLHPMSSLQHSIGKSTPQTDSAV